MNGRSQWKNQLGFILAAVGSAVGLGNIWRFSYVAYSNGGGAFIIPYLIALFTAGIPLLILEFGLGHERIGSAPLALAKISRRWEWLGWWAVIFVMFGIELYYSTVISWCVNYIRFSFDLSWGSDPDSYFFKTFLDLSDSPSHLGGIRTPILLGLAFVWFVNWLVLYRGIQRGIELANRIFMPTLFVLMVVLLAWSVTLDGASTGIKAYLTPDFSKLKSPSVWMDAYGQIFFTLSLGFGIMIAYASYLPLESNISRNAFITSLTNSGFELMAGFAVFSVLGFMSVSEARPIKDVVTQSVGLAFVAYPKAISLIPGGKIFGVIFFTCLFMAGITSSISILEAFTSALVDKFRFNRKVVVTVICILGFLGALVFATRGGLHWLDIVDHFLNLYGLVVVGLLECLVVGWLFRLPLLRKHINRFSSVKLGRSWDFIIKFFLPAVLCIMLVSQIIVEFKAAYGGYSWKPLILIGVDWVLLTFVAAVVISLRPWKTENHKAPGRIEEAFPDEL